MNNDLKYSAPTFTFSMLHPKNWGVWLGFGFLAIIVNILPYSVLAMLGRSMGKFAMRYAQNRVAVTRRNLELAFPDKPAHEVAAIVEENFKNTGMAFIETGIAWFWPTWRFKRLIAVKDVTSLLEHAENNKGVLLCCVHALNLEITARAFAVFDLPGYGAFRPHNNPAYNFIQYWGRTHNGNLLIDRKDVKQMIRVLRQGERLFYLPDHDYGRNKSVFVPFFAIDDACTTTGTSILAYTSHCAIVIASGFRNSENRYELIADESIEANYPKKDPQAAAAYMNKYVEKLILRAPAQWMWLHKRFKTMADPAMKKGCRYQ
ncbi:MULTISPECIES: LpxL/LpxP family Kdo(2)-lipid IV(A) lauroyl/palmitoleoyl acyltransferase [unclassified Vibrio]|uniref:Lipid A biosynthesis acyltransferase n=1 Tax=Vibrio sp. HB236076 TaxID=3232307 RepID=A0AB39HGA1_9VIBR|nr:LpxL/LpxP family Kdo(2)-lipid IV(A) lauroyl/palmitoleoyl acyltransferase [Vibrio sp. HB161653]MDP5255286.1 LpxL/LpxP family Kdo(2)-lipid IV(A) lauroyl/palmitoleoyl acyltransferase [Vibrio sp. HB161653]